MEIACRKFLPSDAAVYRQFRLEALQEAPSASVSTFEEESAKEKLAFEIFIENESPDHFIVGAFAGTELLGICGFSRESRRKIKHRGSIIQVYVKPGIRGAGVGRKLLRKALETAFDLPGLEQVILGVVSTNQPAISLYEKAGFREYGFMKNFTLDYGVYEDERLYILFREDFVPGA